MYGLLAAADLGRFLAVLGVMILLLVVTTVGLLWFRARVLSRGESPVESQGGLLRSLRAMRDRGEITPEEYDQARHAMAQGKERSGVPASPPPAPGPVKPAAEVQELRARPGFDLTGRPLPGSEGASSGGDEIGN